MKGVLPQRIGRGDGRYNYSENNSLMAITRNYSGPAILASGVIAILLGFVGKYAPAATD
jgi:xanthine/uracil permease